MEWMSRIFDLSKIPTKFVGAIALLTFLVTYLPERFLESLNLLSFKEDYGSYFGLAFLVSLAVLSVEFIVWVFFLFRRAAIKRSVARSVRDRLRDLDQSEKAVLREFIIASSRTIKLPIEQPAVSSLINAGVLEQAAVIGSRTMVGSVFSLTLSDEANKELSLDFLDLEGLYLNISGGGLRIKEEGWKWVMENRPSFMRELDKHQSLMEGRFFY